MEINDISAIAWWFKWPKYYKLICVETWWNPTCHKCTVNEFIPWRGNRCDAKHLPPGLHLINSRNAAEWDKWCAKEASATQVGSSDLKDMNKFLSILDKQSHNLTKQILCQRLRLDKIYLC